MNYRMSAYMLAQIALITAGLMLIPFAMSFAYGESGTPLAFGITIAVLVALGIPFVIKKPLNTEFRARGGFILVAIAWIFLSVFGALPFTISGYVPNYIDALFETVSGFTTTGATVIPDIETLPKSLLFWRAFTHWIGGMGVLVFVVAILPKTNSSTLHLLKAEMTGPQFGKLVSKMRFTARILYAIYVVLTLIMAGILMIGKIPVFDAFTLAFATAGTGGFANYATSIAHYNSLFAEITITVFMMVFSINFNMFYFLFIGHAKDVIKNEELRTMFIIYGASVIAITITLMVGKTYSTVAEALRYSSFQVASIMSTTGFATADFTKWPMFAQSILVLLMFIGGSSGSTAGGLKVSRIIIMCKSGVKEIKHAFSPRTVVNVKLDKKTLDDETVRSVNSYLVLYVILFAISFFLLMLDPDLQSEEGLVMGFSTIATCINNVGPALDNFGPLANFSALTAFSKILLCVDMLIGRLEIMPMLLLLYPPAWRRT